MKKRIVALLIAGTMALSLSACGNASNDNTVNPYPTTESQNVQEKSTSTNHDSKTKEDDDEFASITQFISLYNETATTPITDVTDMDIHGADYRTEFRLGAFKNAVGKKGVINGLPICIVNYGNFSNNSIRIYATASTDDSALDIYTTTIHILDSSITNEEMMEEFTAASIYLDGCISGYVNGQDIMLDCTKINFVTQK